MSQQDLEKISVDSTTVMVYLHLSKKSIRKPQLIQKAATLVLSKTKKVDHITPVLRSLHGLPIFKGADLRILLLVYKTLNSLGLKFISYLLLRYEPSRPLRSFEKGLFSVPRVKTERGIAAFNFYASYIWNELAENCRSAATLCSLIKSF